MDIKNLMLLKIFLNCLNENIDFCLKIKYKTIYWIPSKILEYDLFNSALIPFNKSHFIFTDIYEKLMNFKSTKFGSCDISMKINNNTFIIF